MRKISLIVSLILCGCGGLFPPMETIRNPECTNIGKLQVLQVGKDMTLLEAVFYRGESWSKSDVVVKTEDLKIWNGDRYDGEWLSLKNSWACAVIDGTYSYTTVMGSQKTLRKIKFANANIANPEYEKWKAEQESKKQETGTK